MEIARYPLVEGGHSVAWIIDLPVTHPVTGQWHPLRFLLDTGALNTTLPQWGTFAKELIELGGGPERAFTEKTSAGDGVHRTIVQAALGVPTKPKDKNYTPMPIPGTTFELPITISNYDNPNVSLKSYENLHYAGILYPYDLAPYFDMIQNSDNYMVFETKEPRILPATAKRFMKEPDEEGKRTEMPVTPDDDTHIINPITGKSLPVDGLVIDTGAWMTTVTFEELQLLGFKYQPIVGASSKRFFVHAKVKFSDFEIDVQIYVDPEWTGSYNLIGLPDLVKYFKIMVLDEESVYLLPHTIGAKQSLWFIVFLGIVAFLMLSAKY